MDRLKVVPILFVDIGGYLFPDHPEKYTPPTEPILRLTKAHTDLWGRANCFIAANVASSERGYSVDPSDLDKYSQYLRDSDNLGKDVHLLRHFDIFKRTGLIDHPHHFYACNGPESKGPELKEKMDRLSRGDWKVLAVICDNSLTVARCTPDTVYRIVYREKDANKPENAEWLRVPHSTLYRTDSVRKIAVYTATIHLQFLKSEAATKIDTDPELKILYEKEVIRVLSIFRRNRHDVEKHLPKKLLHF